MKKLSLFVLSLLSCVESHAMLRSVGRLGLQSARIVPAVLRPAARVNVTAPAVVGARTFFFNSDFKQQEIKRAQNLLEQLSDNGLSPHEFVQKMEVIEKTGPSFLNKELQAKVQSYIDVRIEKNHSYVTDPFWVNKIVEMASVLDDEKRAGLARHLFAAYSEKKVLHEVDPEKVIGFFSTKNIEDLLQARYEAGALTDTSPMTFVENVLPHLRGDVRKKWATYYIRDLKDASEWCADDINAIKRNRFSRLNPVRLLYPSYNTKSFYAVCGLFTSPFWIQYPFFLVMRGMQALF